MMFLKTTCFYVLFIIDFIHSDLSSYITLHDKGTDFVPVTMQELIETHSSIYSQTDCAFLCHRDPRCRTFVFDPSTCQLYESSSATGQIVSSLSSNSIVGEIDYSHINLASKYYQTCDHCYPDRYLVCKNSRCQCPSNTIWNGQDKCIEQPIAQSLSACNNNGSCRQDLNQTCICNKCQCPRGTFWSNQSCIPQFSQGAQCSTSVQCRNDLQLVCSRINNTCAAMASVQINVTNGTLPAKFANSGTQLNTTGYEWWQAFNNHGSLWNTAATGVPSYLFVTFDDEYLLTSVQLQVYGDYTHDPKLIEFYSDENATCFLTNISYPLAPNGSFYYTMPATSLNNLEQPIVVHELLISIPERWSIYQAWLCELTFYGIPY